MADYAAKLKNDLAEQFRDKAVIAALLEAVGEQMNDLSKFLRQLKEERSLATAVGKQLDGIGELAALTRKEASDIACFGKPKFSLKDDDYRDYLKFKIWENTNNCTYKDIVHALTMFWQDPLYYREDPDFPATLFIETPYLDESVDIEKIIHIPIPKPAGVWLQRVFRFAPFPVEEPIGCLLLKKLDIGVYRFRSYGGQTQQWNGTHHFDGLIDFGAFRSFYYRKTAMLIPIHDERERVIAELALSGWLICEKNRARLTVFAMRVRATETDRAQLPRIAMALPIAESTGTMTGTITKDSYYTMDGTYTFNGERRFNAAIIKEVL